MRYGRKSGTDSGFLDRNIGECQIFLGMIDADIPQIFHRGFTGFLFKQPGDGGMIAPGDGNDIFQLDSFVVMTVDL